jgi:pimeloyl-ACP methyl ester carboxylesterase
MSKGADATVVLPVGASGRQVAVDVTGPDDGPAVLFCHVAPGSRRFDPDPATSVAADVRLITVDRPGYGRSEPLPEGHLPSITGYADDHAAVLDHLGVRGAVLAGWSAGGRVAAAIAARRPDLARALFIVATPAPDEVVPWIPEEQRPAIDAMRADPVGSIRQLAGMLANAVADPAVAVGMMTAGDADAAALDDPDVRRAVEVMLSEAFTQGAIGLASDLFSYTAAPWGFDAAAVGAPTHCVYGDADVLVPPAHGAWWANQIVGAEMTRIPGAGHLVISSAWSQVLTAATS